MSLRFEGEQGAINNAADLAVASRQTLSLSGSNVATTGNLTAPAGRVEVLGTETVALLEDATIDVSAPAGGGTVLIGGDFQGRGVVPNAKRTYVGDNVTINADALTNGNGGKVIVWADEVTGFYGNISARGGIDSGNGGLVEVSGKEHLIFRGNVNTSAVNGLPGILLLDPTNITIADGRGDEAGDGTDSFAGNNSGVEGSILTASLSEIEDTAPTTIYESELEGLSGNTNIVLQATNDITLQDLSDDGLELATGAGVIVFSADADRDGVGDFVMEDNVADTIFTNGRDIAISGASLTIGNIDTSVLVVGDAGELIETALFVSNSPGGALESISGNLSNVEDVDLFQIYLTGEVTFSATTVNPETTLDTQLFLFNADGLGVYANEDQAGCNCFQATLPAGDVLTPTEPGVYYLGIGTFGDNAVSSGGEIFPSSFEAGFEAIKAPTGDGGLLPLSGWIKNPEQGSYRINLTGVEAVEANVVESIQPIGDSGSISLEATSGSININELNTSASSSGQAGNVKAIANNTISMIGSSINSRTSGTGNGGDIYLSARDLNLQKTSVISAATSNIGRGGNINIDVRNLTIEDGSSIVTTTTGTTNNAGRGGDLTVNALESLKITGTIGSGEFLFSSALSTGTFGKGNAGNLTVTTGTLLLKDGGQLLTDTLPDSEGNGGNLTVTASESVQVIGGAISNSSRASALFAKTEGTGKAGNVTIITPNLLVQDGAEVSTSSGSFGTGGGSLTISASESVQVDGASTDGRFPSGVLAFTTGAGNAGNITITTGQLLVQNGGRVSTSTGGEGKAGTVIVKASELVQVLGTSGEGRFQSALLSEVSPGAEGNSGDITIDTGYLSLKDGALVNTGTSGVGNAGGIAITAADAISIEGEDSQGSVSGIFSTVAQGAVGDSEGIKITTDSLFLRDNATVSTRTEGEGKAGDIAIAANLSEITGGGQIQTNSTTNFDAADITLEISDNLFLSGTDTGLFAQTEGAGDAGNITINSPQLTIDQGASISAFTAASGDGGTITVNAPQAVLLTNNSQITVETSNVGTAGNITIITPLLTIGENAQLSTTATETSTSPKAGDITLNVSQLNIAGELGIFAETQSIADAGSLTIQTYQTNSNLNIQFTDEGFISTRTTDIGDGGSITITAPEIIDIRGDGSMTASTSGSGNAGEININTNNLNISDGVEISALTTGAGNAGNITLNLTESLFISDEGSGLFANTDVNSTGDGGDINVNSPLINLEDDGAIAVNSQGQGTGGNISLQADALTLANQSAITAETLSTDGGNIEITVGGNLVLRKNSQISASAGTAAAGGDGGNIKIDAKFVLAFPTEDSDITANAFIGNGGNISITAEGILGIEFREQPTPLSDITASSEFGLAGTVDINATEVNSNRGLITLPQQVDTKIVLGCDVDGEGAIAFYNMGRGGLLASPDQFLTSDTVIGEWLPLSPSLERFPQPEKLSSEVIFVFREGIKVRRLMPPCWQ